MRLTFEERNKLKIELYSGVSMDRKREIISLLEHDEEQSFLSDLKSELGDQEF